MRKLAQYIATYKRYIFILFVLVFFQTLSQLYLPTLMGDIVDNGVVVGNIPYIWKIGALMLFVAAIGVVMSIGISYYASHVAMRVGRDIRNDIFTHVTDFSVHDFAQVGTASLITRTTNDVTQIQQALVMVLRMFLMAPFMLLGGVLMAVSKDFMLSLVILFAVPFIAVAIYFIMKKGYPLFQAVQKRLDRLNTILRENLTGIRVVRAFAKERAEQKRLQRANENLTDVSITVNRLMAFTMPLMMLLMNVTIILIIWFGSVRIDVGTMQIGDLMAFIQYVMLILMALMMASMMFVILPRASVSAKRIEEVLTMKTSKQTIGTETLTEPIQTISFQNVAYRYPNAQRNTLENISFTLEAGKVTAIIGGTGSGKTTLIQLIPRLLEATAGTITVNGKDIKLIHLDRLREKIGYVPQRALLFSGTVKENVRFGKDNASEEEIVHALQIAQADSFVRELDLGYESFIEQGGANLSGGQKQRLSIARALVRQPQIYLFDDSFSALDYETDKKLRHRLLQEASDKIMVIVAQRVSTIIDADQIIVLDKGRIAGIGTHKHLSETNDVYKEIITSQYGKGGIA
ncbi:MAG TPA: ABC transporter ATP-binding protein [Pseudogracilibacillus sp.]|nr:ABC transporter ATP-binding protein [Pseudogracilibacillus sp.]